MILWRIHVASINETYLGVHVTRPTYCPILTKFGFARQIFTEAPTVSNFTENSTVEAACYMRTDGQTDTGKVNGNCQYHANEPKNSTFCPHSVFVCFVWI